MNQSRQDEGKAAQDAVDDLSETERKSKAPRKPEDTDAAGDARNDVGEDNHQSK